MGILYTNLKIFHYTQQLKALPITKARIEAPLHIRLKPTNICNHKCYYCAYTSDNLQLGKDMVHTDHIPKEKMLEIVDDFTEMGVKAVTFSGGGEPFCYPHLYETVRRLDANRIKFAALTNGALVTGEIAEFFAHRATWLRISMDGWDGASYAAYRNVSQKEFSRVLQNIEAFKKMGGGCYLGASIVVDRKNHRHLYQLIARLKDLGVDSVKVSPCIVDNSGRKNNEYHAPVFKPVKHQLSRVISDLHKDSFSVYDAYHNLDDKFQKEYNWCPYLQINPVIGADLNIYPCHDKAYNLDSGLLGSIKETRFKEFWFTDKSKFFRIDPSRDCRHHCVANAKNKMVLEYLEADQNHLAFV